VGKLINVFNENTVAMLRRYQ